MGCVVAAGGVEASVPEMMRAMVTTRHGGPEVVESRRVPVPRASPGHVLVRVGAAGCNNTDLWTRDGAYPSPDGTAGRGGWLGPLDFPRVQGGDVAGTVVACGAGTDTSLAGARVLVDPALYEGPDRDARPVDVLGSERDGGFAEYVVVPEQCAHRVDGSPLSDLELAALPIAYGTALAMVLRGGVVEGSTVVVTGASGGVGLAAVQLARARGARVVAVCSATKGGEVLAAGADAVVDRQRGAVVEDIARVAPEGVHVVIDVVAGETLGPGLGLLRPGGRWVVAGALDGWRVELDVRRLYLANVSLVGSTMHTPAIFEELVGLALRGEVRPHIAATFSLEDLGVAQARLAQREHVGKLMIVP